MKRTFNLLSEKLNGDLADFIVQHVAANIIKSSIRDFLDQQTQIRDYHEDVRICCGGHLPEYYEDEDSNEDD